jgi:hypothetical protein
VHCVVPGGGLSADGSHWIASSPKFFLPVQVLGRLFRGKFLDGLKRLHREGKLKLDACRKAFAAWLSPLYAKDWVVYCQPPLSSAQGPEAVLKYLARYVSGAAICDARLLSYEEGRVTFRAKNYRQGRRRQTLTLPGLEFTRRFLLHVLPRGLVRVRYCGLLANTQRGVLLPRCRQLLGPPAVDQAEALPDSPLPASSPDVPAPLCPACQRGRLRLIETSPRPSWRDVLPPRATSPGTASHASLASASAPRADTPCSFPTLRTTQLDSS